VLLSGGLDWSTALAIARRAGFQCPALSSPYGPRHRAELRAARRVATARGVARHETIAFDPRLFGTDPRRYA
jgi:7-cyano-7-deazaguanine synthase